MMNFKSRSWKECTVWVKRDSRQLQWDTSVKGESRAGYTAHWTRTQRTKSPQKQPRQLRVPRWRLQLLWEMSPAKAGGMRIRKTKRNRLKAETISLRLKSKLKCALGRKCLQLTYRRLCSCLTITRKKRGYAYSVT